MIDLAKLVSEYLAQPGHSVRQMAAECGVSRQAIEAVRDGTTRRPDKAAPGLARLLGITVEEVLGEAEPRIGRSYGEEDMNVTADWPFGSAITRDEWERVPEFERGLLVADLRQKLRELAAKAVSASGKQRNGGLQ